MKNSTKSQENKMRKQLQNQGFVLEKRTNTVDPYHIGSYRILNAHTGNIEAGAEFTLTLEDVEAFVAEDMTE